MEELNNTEELNETKEEINNEAEIVLEEPVILPDVYKKQANPDGAYVDKEGNRYDILTCKITESKEQVQVGTTTETDEEGNEIEVPVYESRVVINKGWDKFDSLEDAVIFYNLEEIENGNN